MPDTTRPKDIWSLNNFLWIFFGSNDLLPTIYLVHNDFGYLNQKKLWSNLQDFKISRSAELPIGPNSELNVDMAYVILERDKNVSGYANVSN